MHLLAHFLVPALGKPLVILLPLLLRRSECALLGNFELRAKQTGTQSLERRAAKPQNARSVAHSGSLQVRRSRVPLPQCRLVTAAAAM